LPGANQAEAGVGYGSFAIEFAFRKPSFSSLPSVRAVSANRRQSGVSGPLTLRVSCTVSGAGLSSVPGAWESDFPCLASIVTNRFCNEDGVFG